jgi:hypothetical protein
MENNSAYGVDAICGVVRRAVVLINMLRASEHAAHLQLAT